MKTIPIYKLGSATRDTATDLKGTLILAQVNLHHQVEYLIQPKHLSEEDGQPVRGLWVVSARVQAGSLVQVEFPVEILGTEVEDVPTGFKGVATDLCLHISGCIHVVIQPKGTLKKTGGPILSRDFDIRRLRGKAVPKLTPAARQASEAAKPSPGHEVGFRTRDHLR